MSKQVLVAMANGIEEIEAVCVIDTLRRSGATVTVASAGELTLTGSRGIKFIADKKLAECTGTSFDLIVVPGGGEGAKNLRDSKELAQMLQKQQKERRLYAAICAAPVVVLQTHGLLEGKQATCHPSLAKDLANSQQAANRVVVDDNCVTSQAPGTALEFALKLVELLFSRNKAEEVAKPMCVAGQW